jgi:hypothetical protein
MKHKGMNVTSKLGKEMTRKGTMRIPSRVGNNVKIDGKSAMDILMGESKASVPLDGVSQGE